MGVAVQQPHGNTVYGESVLRVEPHGIDVLGPEERHGKPRQQFTLWLGSNLTIADFALGFSVVSLGLPWFYGVLAIVLGNLLGAAVLAGCAAMGPTYGQPQLMIGRYTFGRIGGLIPAVLNYISTIGWFTVNNILGSFGLRVLFPHLPFWAAAIMLVIVQGLLAIYGHNLIHTYERVMSVVLGILFLITTVLAFQHRGALVAYHPSGSNFWPMCILMTAFAFSYIGSWGAYASDYSRYLPADTSKAKVFWYTFAGSFIASVWLELVGVAVAILAGSGSADPIAALHHVLGGFGDVAVVAIILGGTAADALNLYSNSLSAAATGIRLPRWTFALIATLVGLTLSLIGEGKFQQNYSDFLLLVGYWMTPWMGVLFADFYLRKRRPTPSADTRNLRPFGMAATVSFLVGIAASIPFMDATFNVEGFISKAMGGADLAFYVGFLVSMGVYLVWHRVALGPQRQA